MSSFEPKRLDVSKINGGEKFAAHDGVTPNAINDPIEAVAWMQKLVETPPDMSEANNVGTASVTIEYDANGYPYFKFSNLKGEMGTPEGESFLTETKAAETYLPQPEDFSLSHPTSYIDFYGTGGGGKMGRFQWFYDSHGLSAYGSTLMVAAASEGQVKAQSDTYKPIPPARLSYAVVIGLTENKITLTDEKKALALTWLGAIKHADTPTGYAAVYAIDRQGNDITVSYSPQVSSWTLAQRGNGGTLVVGAPIEDSHATPKSYVDNLPDKITDQTIKAKWAEWLGVKKYYTHALIFHKSGSLNFTVDRITSEPTAYLNCTTPMAENLFCTNSKSIVLNGINDPSGAKSGVGTLMATMAPYDDASEENSGVALSGVWINYSTGEVSQLTNFQVPFQEDVVSEI